ncbi:MAG TPA: hypothetical protein VH325_13255 [Bryobacteraceae bacterium]|jgi:hypothetical protein|nr:hypothetical protein [Bryobacteraceae bacterium]
MLKYFAIVLAGAMWCAPGGLAQQPPAKAADRVVGAITSVDPAGGKITVKEDKTDAEYAVSIAGTKSLLKVGPDLNVKTATRLTPEQLAAGDRVVVHGHKPEGSQNAIDATVVLVMTKNAVEAVHQKEQEEWKTRATAGVVASVDPSGTHLIMTARTPEGPKPVTVDLAKVTQYTRYSPENPKTPTESKLADIQPGDQVRVLGNKSDDGSTISAEKVYSGSFRTLAATVASIAPDGKTIVVNDLQTKKPVTVELTDDSAVRQMPPQMAMMLARRLNPSFQAAGGPGAANAPGGGRGNGSGPGGPPPDGRPSPQTAGPAGPEGAPGGARPSGMGRGDLTQMIERLPKIPVSDLKPGAAVVVSGGVANANSQLVATNIISGVEPIFQSAPQRGGQNSALNSMWSLGDLSVPGE